MRRSLLLRLLIVSLSVALGAVGAGAILATYSTPGRPQGQTASSPSLLEMDQAVYAELLDYAATHRDWTGVQAIVYAAARRAGRQIALASVDGSLIAVSPEGGMLPSTPAATIDIAGDAAAIDARPAADVRAPHTAADSSIMALAAQLRSPHWRMTRQEQHLRAILTARARQCLHHKEIDAGVVTMAVPVRTTAHTVRTRDRRITRLNRGDACSAADLNLPSAAAQELNRSEIAAAEACLTTAGKRYLVVPSRGLRRIQTPDVERPDATFVDCLRTARQAALAPYVAPPARLYLGKPDRFNPFSGEGLVRTLATTLGVLLIAALITLFAGRRLVRPIMAVSEAAGRMAAGDQTVRVPIAGHDEVARLGIAFNTMASTIERTNDQRRVLVSDIAHELRNPLSNIRGHLEAAEVGVVALDPALVRSLLDEAAVLERLVSDLQVLTLADAGELRLHPEPHDIAELTRQTVAAHQAAAEAGNVSLQLATDGRHTARVDPTRFRQALANLVANAISFTPLGGTVSVSVRTVADDVRISVADTGPGITSEHLPHLFSRFYRADPSRSRTTGGSGLGLAIARQLVEAHNGDIAVSSTPGHGSVFTISVPCSGPTSR